MLAPRRALGSIGLSPTLTAFHEADRRLTGMVDSPLSEDVYNANLVSRVLSADLLLFQPA